jgi:hypothetical protein
MAISDKISLNQATFLCDMLNGHKKELKIEEDVIWEKIAKLPISHYKRLLALMYGNHYENVVNYLKDLKII